MTTKTYESKIAEYRKTLDELESLTSNEVEFNKLSELKRAEVKGNIRRLSAKIGYYEAMEDVEELKESIRQQKQIERAEREQEKQVKRDAKTAARIEKLENQLAALRAKTQK